MIEDSKFVKSIEAKSGGKSGTYWTVTWQDEKHDNIFNNEWLPILESAQENNRLVHFGKEKHGQYYNIVSLELASETQPPKETGSDPKYTPRKDAVAENIRENMEWKQQHIERSFWINQLGEMIRAKDIDLSTPHGKLLRSWYYAEMFRVLDIKIE